MGAEEAQAQNVAVASRSFELYSEGGVEAARPTWGEDCVWNDPPDLPDAAVYRGPEEVAARLEELWAILPLDGLDIEQALPVGDSDVLLIVGFHGKGGGGGIPVDQPMGCIVTVRDGLIREWRPFLNGGDARSAAGL